MFKLYTVSILPIEYNVKIVQIQSGFELLEPPITDFSIKSTQNDFEFLNPVKALNAFFQKINCLSHNLLFSFCFL